MKTVSPNRDVGSNPTSGVYRGVAKRFKAMDFDSIIAGSNPAVSAHGSVTKPGKVRGRRRFPLEIWRPRSAGSSPAGSVMHM